MVWDPLNIVLTDDPAVVAVADVVRVLFAGIAAFTIVLYLRLGVCRWRRGHLAWPVCGMVSLILLLVVAGETVLERRGMPVTVRGVMLEVAVPLAAVEARRNWRLRARPRWARPGHAGSHRR